MVTLGIFSIIFDKGKKNICDFLFDFMLIKPLLKRDLIQREWICATLRRKFFPFRVDSFSEGRQNNFKRATSPLKAAFPETVSVGYIFSSPAYRIGSGASSVVGFDVGTCRRRRQYFQTVSPLKPLSQLKPNYIGWKTKVLHDVWVTWPRWPPCAYVVKTFENLLLRNRMADDLETWYAA